MYRTRYTAVYACAHGRVRARFGRVYGPLTRLKTCNVSCTRPCTTHDRVHCRVHDPLHGSRVHGQCTRFRPCKRPVHGRITAVHRPCRPVYTAVYGPCTRPVYKAVYVHVHDGPCTQPSTRPMYTKAYIAVYSPYTRPLDTAAYGPCTRQCTRHVHGCERAVYTDTGRVHGACAVTTIFFANDTVYAETYSYKSITFKKS